MNVASLELSKELYELSGWEDLPDDSPWYTERGVIGYERSGIAPAYDLGYLRKKILDELERQHPESKSLLSWAHFDDLSKALLNGEDATASFAIELFKQGVLTRGSDA